MPIIQKGPATLKNVVNIWARVISTFPDTSFHKLNVFMSNIYFMSFLLEPIKILFSFATRFVYYKLIINKIFKQK